MNIIAVCLEKGCVETASWLLESLDTSVCPCKDFYQFACGKWIEQAVIPEHSSGYSQFYRFGKWGGGGEA